MHPFIVFAIILIVIWTLSGIASAANRQKEQQRRRKIAQEMARAAGTAQSPPALRPQRRIAQGLAARYPQVLAPAQPSFYRRPKPTAVPRPLPPRAGPARKGLARMVARAVQHIAQPFKPIAPPPLSTPAPPSTSPHQAVLSGGARAPAAAAPPIRSADAPAIARWLTPRTMQQQFILTEILQPPLALREQQAGDLR